MAVKVSDISSKTGKKCIFGVLGCPDFWHAPLKSLFNLKASSNLHKYFGPFVTWVRKEGEETDSDLWHFG